MGKLFDSKCYDLAVHFLCDDHAEASDRACLDDLARTIQSTIEGFLSTHECRKAYDVPIFDGGKHYLPDVRSDVHTQRADARFNLEREEAQAEDDAEATRLGLCRCSSSDEDVRATACTVHGRAA